MSKKWKPVWAEFATIGRAAIISAFAVWITAACLRASAQAAPGLEGFLRQNIGLSQDEVAAIRKGQPVTKILPSRTPAEVFLFGAVYINAVPERYLEFNRDFERLRKLPNYLGLGVIGNPAKPSDLAGFSFEKDDIQALKNCKPGDCLIQMPAGSMEEVRRSINWSSPAVSEEVNQFLQKTAVQRLAAYRREGNAALGFYDDKSDPIDVRRQFADMLSYSKVLPARLPDFYNYLLAYPDAKPANVEDTIYWERVNFGLKPTLRVVQKLIRRGGPNDSVAYAFAEKQLYSSHYFETALDLSFCIRGEANLSGFYLIMLMSSEQAGLTGIKGSVVRKVAVGRSVSNLRDALATIKSDMEHQ
jgi:hypothetical protein